MANHVPAQIDLRSVIHSDPKISRFLNSGNKQLIVGLCPICKWQETDWNSMKAHVVKCRREHQHPLLMRTCYCPFCLKKFSDGYSLSSHIQSTHSANLQNIADCIKVMNNGVIVAIDDEGKRKGVRQYEGWPMRRLKEPFPFGCSACAVCWPTAKGLVSHFMAKERQNGGKSCGGHLNVYIRPGSRRMTNMNDDIACNRYDFSAPISCPYCTEAFEEAYALSAHVRTRHGNTQAALERKFTPLIATAPPKKYYFAPFSCGKCRSAFKSMEEWAWHVHERTMNGQPCNGELRIMKKVPRGDGTATFLPNVPPAQQREGQEGDQARPAQPLAEQPASGPQPTYAEVKAEPLDADNEQPEPVPDDPSSAAAAAPAAPVAADKAAAAAAGKAVVKDEPMDEDEVPTTSQQPASAQEQMEEVEQGQQFECDEEECGGRKFFDKQEFIEHMREHGYVLEGEEETATSIAEPIPKRVKKEEEEEDEPGPSSRYPPLIAHSNPADNFYKCPHCPETCVTLTEFIGHTQRCHTMTSYQAFSCTNTCNVCRKRQFTSEADREQHEKECRVFKLSEAREKAFSETVACYYCKRRLPNVFVLLHHFMDEHEDTVEKLRENYLMASEFLPFRCSACNVGFEDPRTLLNHFRLREEFGIPCTGNLIVHTYLQSLTSLDQLEQRLKVVEIPKLGDQDNDEHDECPRDPRPSEDIDLTSKGQCPHCNEIWPRAQMYLHVKMEHPRIYNDYAKYHCKKCKGDIGFFCQWRYAEHWEACTADEKDGTPGPFDLRQIVCSSSRMQHLPLPPAAHRYNLPGIPEGMGNAVRGCRICKQRFSPEELLRHQKTAHPIQHFTDAPYQCQRCADVGFYHHENFRDHVNTCTGTPTWNDQVDLFAITVTEIEEKTGVKREETPSYRALIDADRRKYGHLAAFNRPLQCSYCKNWSSCLSTLVEHHTDSHPHREPLTFLCGGCAKVCFSTAEMKEHMEEEKEKGNSRCYDQASLNGSGYVFSTPNQSFDLNRFMRTERPPPMIPYRAGMLPKTELDFSNARRFKNLARQEACERRNSSVYQQRPTTLLPIRPMSQLSKSPLSGERALFLRQQASHAYSMKQRGRTIEQAQVQADNLARFRQTQQIKRETVHQHGFNHVDFSTPLGTPSTLHRHDGRRVLAINTPIPPRPSILYQPLSSASGMPVPARLTLSNPVTGAAMNMHKATSSFRPSPSSSSSYTIRRPDTGLGTQPLRRLTIHPPPPTLEPMNQSASGSKAPKKEPKQEPDN